MQLGPNGHPRRRWSRVPESSSQIDALVERLALSSDCDPRALDRVLAFKEEAYQRKAKAAFSSAFSMLQSALPTLSENGEIRDNDGRLSHTYALWEDINEVIKPILADHGFSLWFRTEVQENLVVVTAVLSHAGGHREETTLRFPVDLSGGKNPVQAIGSSTSYGKRYTASALLNLISRGEDDDGAGSSRPQLISDEQVDTLRAAARDAGADETKLTAYLRVPRLEELPLERFQRAFEAIRVKGGSK